jgi:hypothetical protein
MASQKKVPKKVATCGHGSPIYVKGSRFSHCCEKCYDYATADENKYWTGGQDQRFKGRFKDIAYGWKY